jgi:phosphatidate cytidylyltransferase
LRLDKRGVGARDGHTNPAERSGVPAHGDSGAAPPGARDSQPGRDSEPGRGSQPGVGSADRVDEPRPRTGRNLPVAVAIGLTLGAAAIVTLFTVKATFLAYLAPLLAVAAWELQHALRSRRIHVPLLPIVAGGAAMVTLGYWVGARAAMAAMALTVIALLAWRLPGGAAGYLRDLTASIFAVGYLMLPAVFVAFVLARPRGAVSVLIFVVLAVCSDTGGYFAGTLIGRHPMAPAISPHKTWEGFAGSAAACLVAGGILLPTALHGHIWQGLVVGAAAVAAATLGDLVESMIKRDLDIKDMGSVLPGHGGVLDRIDSYLVVAPVFWLLLTAFIPAH